MEGLFLAADTLDSGFEMCHSGFWLGSGGGETRRRNERRDVRDGNSGFEIWDSMSFS
jgi:hypothetical protein